jgi:protein-S-isoprenylcysteine O-methyltransferase Ste14
LKPGGAFTAQHWTPDFMLALRSILFALLLPGTVTVVIPWFIAHRNHAAQFSHWTLWSCAGLLPLGAGVGLLFWCIWNFAAFGRGTLAPVDPPTRLVVRGPYRFVRNPMYVGGVLILLGEAALFESTVLLIYCAAFVAVTHCFVVLYEEPRLRRQFGESYEAYRRRVRRWWPRMPN